MTGNNAMLVAGLPLGEHAHWDDNEQLVVTSAAVMDKINRPYLSVSTAKAIDKCPASYVADRSLKGGFDLMGAAEIGTAAHSVMERLLALPPVRRDPNHATKILVQLARDEPESHQDPDYARLLSTDPVVYAQWIAAVSAAYSGLFSIEDPREVDLVGSELELVGIELNGVPFRGFVDRLDRVEHRGEKVLRVVDYKSGKAKLKKPPASFGDAHGDQIKTYIEGVEVLTGERPKLGQLYYTGPGGGVRRVSVSRLETRKALKDLAVSWDNMRGMVEAEKFPTHTSPLCGWCVLVNACPAAAREGKVDRKGGLPEAAALGLALPAVKSSPDSGPELRTPPTLDVDSENERNGDMTNPTRWPEAKPYDAPILVRDGVSYPNLNSYGASVSYGLAWLAVEQLTKHGQALTPKAINAMADTLSTMHRKIQRTVTGHDDVASGAATRMSGVLRSVLDVTPMPFGGDTPAWTEWANKCIKRAVLIANKANDLILNGPNTDYPWRGLAIDPEPAAPADVDAWDAQVPAAAAAN